MRGQAVVGVRGINNDRPAFCIPLLARGNVRLNFRVDDVALRSDALGQILFVRFIYWKLGSFIEK